MMNRPRSWNLLAALAALAIAGPGPAAGSIPLPMPASPGGGGCEAEWLPTFGAIPATSTIRAAVVFDDGSGPALYVGGAFTTIYGVPANHVAKWDGSTWSALGAGVDDTVLSLEVFDDGSGAGPALIVGGRFESAGGQPAACIAGWDGSSWSSLGAGLSGPGSFTEVNALAVFDVQGASRLYVGGAFDQAGGQPACNIASWDGSSWRELGEGVGPAGVYALAVFDDGGGGGPRLYVGGKFTQAGGFSVERIASWDGTLWRDVGGGFVEGTFTGVNALHVHDDGNGSALYAGGSFASAGGTPAESIAKWNGVSWSALGGGVDGGIITTMESFGGPHLYVGGLFTEADGSLPASRIARWDGGAWALVGAGMDGTVFALEVFEAGGAPALYAVGDFTSAGEAVASKIASWDETEWSALGLGIFGAPTCSVVFEGVGGPQLHVGGIGSAGGVVTRGVARWDGEGWSALGEGVQGGAVNALAVFDDGNGLALYAGGAFQHAGGGSAKRIAKWDGSSWSALGAGLNGAVRALEVFDDGRGPALYVGGEFTNAGGSPASHVAKWDGASWSALGSGTGNTVYALEVYRDPILDRDQLFAGGRFTGAGGGMAARIARWNGASWNTVGTGMNDWVFALTTLTEPWSGESVLYAGGEFTSAGSNDARRVARWDGHDWSGVGNGTNDDVRALDLFDDGNGLALYAGGDFTIAGTVPASRVARWDGAAWTALGAGVYGRVDDLIVCDDGRGGGPALFVGGDFNEAPDSGDAHLAVWGHAPPGCSEQGSAYCFGDGSGEPCPCGNEGDAGRGCANSVHAGGALLGGSGTADVAYDSFRLHGDDLSPGQPALLFQGDNAVGGGQGVAFGDGLRCAGGAVVRVAVLASEFHGDLSYPLHGEPSISARGAVLPGQTKRYQLWYRDPSGSPCGSAFNLSNGYEVTWQ